eukprot:6048529-Amphidinium_carterae.1
MEQTIETLKSLSQLEMEECKENGEPAANTPVMVAGKGNSSKTDLKIGLIVVCSSGVKKADLDNKKARVVKLLAQKCRVELLEGPMQGSTHDYPYEKVAVATDAPAAASSHQVPAAASGASGGGTKLGSNMSDSAILALFTPKGAP